MPSPLSIVALFCDDIREEVGGKLTIVGIYPETITVPVVPGALAKLGVYVRINIPPDYQPKQVSVTLKPIGQPPVEMGRLDAGLLEKARGEQAHGSPYATIIVHATIGPFLVPAEGRAEIVVNDGGPDLVVGFLNARITAPGAL